MRLYVLKVVMITLKFFFREHCVDLIVARFTDTCYLLQTSSRKIVFYFFIVMARARN